MAYNKVLFPDKTIAIDLTEDTVTKETLALGYTAHNKAGELIVGEAEFGTSDENLQENKTATPKAESQVVYADEGYIGLKKVTIEAVPTETIEITTSGTYTPNDGYFFDKVNVNIGDVVLSEIIIKPTTEEQIVLPEDYASNGFSKVTVQAVPLQSIEITSTGEYFPDSNYIGFSNVFVYFESYTGEYEVLDE